MRAFEEVCGLGRGNISNMSPDGSLGSDKLSKIIDTFPEIDLHWLLTGVAGSEKPSDALSKIESSGPTDMLDRMLQLAEENGRLKARIEQLEHELEKVREFSPVEHKHSSRLVPATAETAP